MNDNTAKYAIILTKPNDLFFTDNNMQDTLANAVNSQEIKTHERQQNQICNHSDKT